MPGVYCFSVYTHKPAVPADWRMTGWHRYTHFSV